MALLIIGGILYIGWIFYVNQMDKSPYTGKPMEHKCPPHKWNWEKDHNNEEIMICSICRRRPSYISRE